MSTVITKHDALAITTKVSINFTGLAILLFWYANIYQKTNLGLLCITSTFISFICTMVLFSIYSYFLNKYKLPKVQIKQALIVVGGWTAFFMTITDNVPIYLFALVLVCSGLEYIRYGKETHYHLLMYCLNIDNVTIKPIKYKWHIIVDLIVAFISLLFILYSINFIVLLPCFIIPIFLNAIYLLYIKLEVL